MADHYNAEAEVMGSNTPSLRDLLNTLQKTVAINDETLSVLQERLSPILTPDMRLEGGTKDPGDAKPVTSEVQEIIANIIRTLDLQIKQVSTLITRINI